MICFAAHPDDETIGAGGQLPSLEGTWIVHATDGAPFRMDDAHNHGFHTRDGYARARHKELLTAMSLAGISADKCVALGFIDQECSERLCELVYAVTELLREIRPRTALVPPYEGGHPDHDSLAFAVHTACGILKHKGNVGPRIVEYTLYHGGGGHFNAGNFLRSESRVLTVQLSEEAGLLKRKMLDCFVTQRNTLVPFQTDLECFRIAPAYAFSAPPHSGTLYYENFDWGVTGARWRELAKAAEDSLGIHSVDGS